MIVDGCTGNANMANVYSLNSTAARLWIAMENRDFDVNLLADILCDSYDVDRARAEADATALVGKWQAYGFLLP